MVQQKSIIKEKGIIHLNGITAKDIIQLLAERHYKDVFVKECKNGETWGARDLLKLDAWVLKKTYSPLTMIGYEVKVSRQDFDNDNKWEGYLDLCHEFYFVCPAGLIRESDLPKRVGIMWVNNNILRTKRKAQRVEPDYNKLVGLLIYVLMARSKITANMNDTGEEPIDRLQEIRDTIKRANERQELASFVQGHIRECYKRASDINTNISNREYQLKQFEERLAKIGIIWNSKEDNWKRCREIENEIDALGNKIGWNDIHIMKSLGEQLIKTSTHIEELRKRNEHNNTFIK